MGAALALQLYLIVRNMTAEGATVAEAVWRYFAYFTILTNSLVFAVLARGALKPGDERGLNAPRIELMMAVSITFVGVVYNLLLASRWNPQGLQKIADLGVHDAAPILGVLYWLLRPHGHHTWRDALFCALWPTSYAAYALTRGQFDGFYAYFFMDPTTLTWPELWLNVAGLSLAFVIGAFAFLTLDGAMARRAAAKLT
ncbi:integral membrane protein [alpha proteobacterium U9-1i]|nr:integral membrane protein [alpha proteobacterium U9-1i]